MHVYTCASSHVYGMYAAGATTLPSSPPFADAASYSWTYRAIGKTHTIDDPHTFKSSSAVYYLTVAAE